MGATNTVKDPDLASQFDRFRETGLERAVGPLLLCLYSIDVLVRSSVRPLWFDELISYHVARLPTLVDIWLALEQTADAHPPLSHLMMRTAHWVFGPGELGSRVPAALMFGIMSWCIYVFVGRRIGRAYGAVAMLFAWLTWGYEYSYEARPYALLMGFSALSFVFWRGAIEGRHRRWALGGLACSLAAALSTHFYAILLFVPLGVGELTRTLRQEKIDRPVWLVLLLTPLCLLAYLPIALGVGTEYTQGFWSPVEWHDLYGFYLILLAPAVLPCAAALVVAGIVSRKWGKQVGSPAPEFSLHEQAAVYALAGIPLVFVLLTMALTGAFVYRYPLAALFGVSVLFTQVVHSWLGNNKVPAWTAASVLAVSFVVLRLAPTVALTSSPTPVDGLQARLEAIVAQPACPTGPIVVSSPLQYLAFAHYAPKELRERLVYPADPPSAREATETDSPDVSLIKVAPWADLNVPSYDEFRAASTNFCVATYSNARFDWILGKLQDEPVPPALLEEDDLFQLFRCCGEGSDTRATPDRSLRASTQK